VNTCINGPNRERAEQGFHSSAMNKTLRVSQSNLFSFSALSLELLNRFWALPPLIPPRNQKGFPQQAHLLRHCVDQTLRWGERLLDLLSCQRCFLRHDLIAAEKAK